VRYGGGLGGPREARANTARLPSAYPERQLGDELVVGGVISSLGVGQEVVTQHPGGSVCADHRPTGHGGTHWTSLGPEFCCSRGPPASNAGGLQQVPALIVEAVHPPQLPDAGFPGLGAGIRLAARSKKRC
jgi:hypothetical protein